MTWLKLEAVELDPGSTYEARLRVQMVTPEDAADEEERYEGQWSEWSLPVRFPAPRRRGGRLAALQGSGLCPPGTAPSPRRSS